VTIARLYLMRGLAAGVTRLSGFFATLRHAGLAACENWTMVRWGEVIDGQYLWQSSARTRILTLCKGLRCPCRAIRRQCHESKHTNTMVRAALESTRQIGKLETCPAANWRTFPGCFRVLRQRSNRSFDQDTVFWEALPQHRAPMPRNRSQQDRHPRHSGERTPPRPKPWPSGTSCRLRTSFQSRPAVRRPVSYSGIAVSPVGGELPSTGFPYWQAPV
jgi:hypothetical protein